jgi:uncharacterized membrane protein HdeD (DUF308 family)
MIQLYLLSILFNGLIGFLLVFDDRRENGSIDSSMKFSTSSGGFRLILGILAAITGIIKLFSPIADKATVYILGDLLPALAGIAAGFIMVFGFYREFSTKIEDEGQLDRVGDTFLRYKKFTGVALMVIAVLHFLFPTALFL